MIPVRRTKVVLMSCRVPGNSIGALRRESGGAPEFSPTLRPPFQGTVRKGVSVVGVIAILRQLCPQAAVNFVPWIRGVTSR